MIWPVIVRSAMVVLGVVGCGPGGSAPASEFVVRDSAGVAVTEFASLDAAALPEWSLDTLALLRIGSVAGPTETQLYRVRDATRLSDGRIALINGGSQEIRVFGSAGAFQFSVGRKGEGPGEYVNLRVLDRLPGDSLLAYGSRTRRPTVYAPDGTQVREVVMARSDIIDQPMAALPDGSLLVRTQERMEQGTPAGPMRGEITFAVWRADADALQPVVTLPAEEALLHRADGFSAGRWLTFGRAPFAAVTGTATAEILAGVSDTYEFRRYHGGRLSAIVRVARPAELVPAGEFERIRDSVLGLSGAPDTRRFWASLYEAMPRHDTYPAYIDLRGDTEGNAWVREPVSSRPGETAWLVFGPSGRAVARVYLPALLDLKEIGADYVLGVETDELETEQVVVYGLDRGALR